MIEKEIKRELTEKIADQSFNACICLKIQQNGDYLPVYINPCRPRALWPRARSPSGR